MVVIFRGYYWIQQVGFTLKSHQNILLECFKCHIINFKAKKWHFCGYLYLRPRIWPKKFKSWRADFKVWTFIWKKNWVGHMTGSAKILWGKSSDIWHWHPSKKSTKLNILKNGFYHWNPLYLDFQINFQPKLNSKMSKSTKLFGNSPFSLIDWIIILTSFFFEGGHYMVLRRLIRPL